MISVLIPCYGPQFYADFLPEAVASLQAQTYSHWEAVVATDTGPAFMTARELSFRDPRVRPLEGVADVERAAGHARNEAAKAARGDFFLPFDPDDLLEPTFLEKTLGAMPRLAFPLSSPTAGGARPARGLSPLSEEKEIAYAASATCGGASKREKEIAYAAGATCGGARKRENFADPNCYAIAETDLQEFGSRGNRHSWPHYSNVFQVNTFLVASLVTRKLWEDVGGYDEGAIGYDDWDFWVRCYKRFAYCLHVAQIREPLYRYRIHEKSQSQILYGTPNHDVWTALLQLRHPDVYSQAARDHALKVALGMNDSVRESVRVRLKCFPENAKLRELASLLSLSP